MKVAFLQETVNQNIGVMYLSALAKRDGHECELFVEPLERDFYGAVRAAKPDVVGISVITGAHHWALDAARRLKEADTSVFTIMGGPHPTYFSDMVNDPSVDAVARGEAEISFPRLLALMRDGKPYRDTDGFWIKERGVIHRNDVAALVDDLSSLPHPDRGLYLKYRFFREQTEVPFSTTRGCPYRCAFCYNHVKAALYASKGRYVRTRAAADVIREMEAARGMYPNMRSIILYDDIIGLDKKWLAEFSGEYARKIGLPWFTSIHADVVDEFVADQLGKAKCFCLSIGLETGDEELRSRVLGKKISDEHYIKAVRLLKNAGIRVRTSNMLFLPGEDVKKALKTIDLNRRMKVDFAWAYTLQPYPGTKIYEDAVRTGYLSEAFQFDDIDPLGLLEPIISLKDRNKLLVVHRFFPLAVRSGIVRKILNFLVHVPPNPLFDAVYSLSLVFSYAEYHQVSFWFALKVAWNNYSKTKNEKRRRQR